MKSHINSIVAFLLLAFASTSSAECPWTTGDEVCSLFLGDSCPGTAHCMYEDCLGKNFGEDVMIVPGGGFATIWIARTDGYFFEFGTYPCDVASHRGTNILEIPEWEDGHKGCVVGLQTDEHWYVEFFGSNPDTGCFGWAECQCG